jgi:hypothetical protein
MPRFIRDTSVSLAVLGLFLATLGGQFVAGGRSYNEDQQPHNQAPVSLGAYGGEGHVIEAVFEHWERALLQDAVSVVFTVFLIQRGASESKDPDQDEAVDADPRQAQHDPQAPWPVRRGGVWLGLYRHSLLITFVLLFLDSFALHAIGGAEDYSSEQLQHGGHAVSAMPTVAPRASGASRSSTGNANFWPCFPWSCSPSSCANRAHRSRSR